MINLFRSILILGFLIILGSITYQLFLKPIITTWGASQEEVLMPMIGDNQSLITTSTRAIRINASQSDVWKWLIQLGADREGFYSYDFIETALGYKMNQQSLLYLIYKTLKVGDVIRGSIDEKSAVISYNFPVLYVKPQESFVLKNWGIFLLKPISQNQTCLIIRTQQSPGKTLLEKVEVYFSIPLHYIMERKMLLGIKERAEGNKHLKLSQAEDILWFSGIAVTGFMICIVVFISKGIFQSIFIPTIFSILWLLTLLIFAPIPLYSMSLLLLQVCTIRMLYKRRRIPLVSYKDD